MRKVDDVKLEAVDLVLLAAGRSTKNFEAEFRLSMYRVAATDRAPFSIVTSDMLFLLGAKIIFSQTVA